MATHEVRESVSTERVPLSGSGEASFEDAVQAFLLVREAGRAVDAMFQASPTKTEGGRFVGKDFYLSNGIPVSLLLLLLKNSLEQANSSFETQINTALATGGFVNDDGTISQEGMALAALIAEAQQDAGYQEAVKTMINAAKSLSTGVVQMVSGPVVEAAIGNPKVEAANIDKLKLAKEAAKSVESTAVHVGEVGPDVPAEEVPAIKRAISDLQTDVDFLETSKPFGARNVGTEKDPKYERVSLADGGDATISVKLSETETVEVSIEKAIAASHADDKKKIMDRLDKRLEKAERDYEMKAREIDRRKQTWSRIMDGFSQIAAGGFDFASKASIIEKAEKEAKQTMIHDISKGMGQVLEAQNKQTDKSVQAQEKLLQAWEAAVRTVGQRA